ncbi:MAG: hypothetical protein ABII96_10520 [Candidatus Zixiibacteriota bacterium]
MQEKLRFEMGSWTTLVLMVAILLVLNLISVNLFTRLDLTEGRVFSLSPATQRIEKSG